MFGEILAATDSINTVYLVGGVIGFIIFLVIIASFFFKKNYIPWVLHLQAIQFCLSEL